MEPCGETVWSMRPKSTRRRVAGVDTSLAARAIMRDHRQTGKARRREDMATTEKETAGALDTDLIQLDAFLRSANAPPECMMLSDLGSFYAKVRNAT